MVNLFQNHRRLIVLFLLCFYQITMAQEVSMLVEEKSINAENGQLIGFTVKITNHLEEETTVFPKFNLDEKNARIVNRYAQGIRLKPSETRFLSVKLMIANAAEANKSIPLQMLLHNALDEQLAQENIQIRIKERKIVKLQIISPNITFESEKDTLSVPVKVTNMGNSKQTVSVITRFMTSTNDKSFERSTFVIEAFKDTVFFVKKIIDKELLKEDSFRITLRGVYADGNVFGSGSIMANSVKNARKFVYDTEKLNVNSFQQNNQLRASVMKNGDNMQYFLYANNQVELPGGTLQSNIDMNYIEANNLYFIRNTWLRYDAENYGFKAGNLYGLDVVNLIGRGAEGYLEHEKSRIEVGGIDKSPNLINNSPIKYGNSLWGRYFHNDGWLDNGYEISVLYDDDPNLHIKNYFATGKTAIINSENLKLRAGASFSNSQANNDTSVSQVGASGEVRLLAKQGRFQFSSNNFYSTGYYAGLRKGVLNLIEKINYNNGKQNIWLGYNLLKFDPKSLVAQQNRFNQFFMQRVDVGASSRLENVMLSVNPHHISEWRNSFNFIDDEAVTYRMESYNLGIGINYSSIGSGHGFSLNFIGGSYITNLFEKDKSHFKAIFYYSYKNFRLNGFYQHNHFTVGEVVSSQYFPDQNYYLVNIVPSYYKSFFKDRLQLQLGMTYTKNSFYDGFLQVNGRADYEIPGNISLFFTTFFSDFSSNYYDTSTMQFGVIKRFAKISLAEKRFNLKVVLYRVDEVGNEIRRTPAANELIYIGDQAFRTNDKGEAVYRRLPQGAYAIKIVNKGEWYAQDTSVDLNSNRDLIIELNKTVPIIGKVSYQFSEFSYNIAEELYSLPIVVTDDSGNTFSARTDSRGNFRLYVPEGNYIVRLDKPKRMELIDVPDNNQFIEVKSGVLKQVNFTLKVRERRVERKKF